MSSINYTDTMRDVKAAVLAEAREGDKKRLERNIDALELEYKRVSKEVQDLRLAAATAMTEQKAKDIATSAIAALTERVDWLVWMIRGVFVAGILELAVAITVSLLLKGSK